jgi:DNA-binding NarL/FixJ family response regulator
VKVLVLEPDYWRSLGILQVLRTDGSITVLTERDHKKVLSMRNAPSELDPHVVIVSHSLTFDYQLSVLQHLQTIFPKARILVEGYDDTLDAVANVLRAGARGYFQLSGDPSKLLEALTVVEQGRIWAPREAMVLLITQFSDESAGQPVASASALITAYEAGILKLLQRGLSNKEIAESFGVAEVTIKAHLTKLYRKFSVRTRLELLAYAMTHHLIARKAMRPTPSGSHRGA